MSKGDNFNDCPFIKTSSFDAMQVYPKTFSKNPHKGKKFPNNELFEMVKRIRKSKVLSGKAFIGNQSLNLKDDANENLKFCLDEGVIIDFSRSWMAFNTIEKDIF